MSAYCNLKNKAYRDHCVKFPNFEDEIMMDYTDLMLYKYIAAFDNMQVAVIAVHLTVAGRCISHK